MSSVDDRIVNMKFNNKQFTEGVTQTQNSLKGLDKTLASAGKAKGLQTMANSVDGMKKKFSVMQVAGVAAVATIASKATSAGISLIKSFTLDPIMDGFREYQTNLNSIQTIMANTGKSVGVVNGYLGKLNQYSDKTIYNFSEMARNIGTFTAAGVGLKTSVAAIQGISNLAALSGSTSQQASTAMYQLSQAIAAGRVGLQDWNSVVNAGMGGKTFQKALATTATHMGSLNKNAITGTKNLKIMGESFRESISAKPGQVSWLTSDVLTSTLKMLDGRLSKTALADKGYDDAKIKRMLEIQRLKLKDAGYSRMEIKNLLKTANAAYESATVVKTLPQLMSVVKESIGSMWASAFQNIFGNFQQSKKLWTGVSHTISGLIGGMSQSLNGMLANWSKMGGRANVIKGFANIFTALGKVLGSVKDAFMDIFPPSGTKTLLSMSQGFADLTSHLVPTQHTVDNLRTIFAGFFATAHMGWVVIKALGGAIGAFLGAIFKNSSGATGGLLDIAAALSEGRIAIDKWLSKGDVLIKTFTNIGGAAGAFVGPLVQGIGQVIKALASLVSGGGVSGFMDSFNGAKASFLDFVDNILKGVQLVVSPFSGLSKIVEDIRAKIAGLADGFRGVSAPAENFNKAISSMGGSGSLIDKVSTSTSKAMGTVSDSFTSAKDSVESAYKSMGGAGATAASAGTGAVVASAQAGSSVFEKLGDILSSIGSGLKKAASSIGDAISWVGNQLGGLFSDFDSMDWVGLMNGLFSGALIIQIRNFLKTLENMPSMRRSITETFGALKDTLGQMQQTLKAQALKAIAIAVALLAASVIALSFIDPKDLAKSVGAIASIMGLLVGSLFALSKINGTFSLSMMAGSLAVLGGAIMEVALAMTLLAHQDPKKLAVGLGFMAGGIAVLVGAMFALSLISGPIKGSAASILILSIAMNMLATAVLAFGLIPFDTLKQGLGGMGIALGMLTLSLMLMAGLGPSIMAAGAAMVMIAVAMNILVTAVLALGLIPMDVLQQGMTAMAIAIGLLTISLMLLAGAGPGVMAAGAAMIMMAVTMNMLMTVILGLGAAPWDVVKQGLLAVAIALAILLLAGAAAMVVGPGLIMLGTAVALLGAAMALAGVGMLAFGTGFAVFAAAGVAGVAIITAAFHVFLAMLPTLAIQLASALVAFLKAIANAAPKIRKALGTIISNLLGVVRDAIPKLGKVISALLTAGIKIIQKFVPQFIEMGFTIIDKFLQSANKHIPSITRSAIQLVTRFLNVLGNNVGKLADAGANLIIKTINGIAKAIDNHAGELRTAGLNLARSLIDGLTGGLLSRGIEMVRNAVSQVANTLPDWFKKLWKINSPSKVMIPIGHSIGEGLARGITNSIPLAVSSAVAMANAVVAKTNAAVRAVQDIASARQGTAYSLDATATIRDSSAKQAESKAAKLAKIAGRIKGDKAHKKAKAAANARAHKAQSVANAQRRAADAARKAADAAQATADAAAQRVVDQQAYEDADTTGKADIRDSAAVSLAKQAQQALARANAQSVEAKKLAKTNKAAAAKMQADAKKSSDSAAEFARQAQQAHQDALNLYARARAEAAAEVRQRIADIKAVQKAEADARAADEAYDLADTKGKAEIMAKRAEDSEAKAAKATSDAALAMAQAEALANSDPGGAMKLLDIAESKAAEAKQAADDAKSQKDQAADLAAQAEQESGSGGSGSGGSGGGGSSVITPSRTALEDAAKAVDRYTASLTQAEEAAANNQQLVQFIQNNTSPKALSASEIYRQSKNLLSAREVKMGANS